jgi:hypothetical protein
MSAHILQLARAPGAYLGDLSPSDTAARQRLQVMADHVGRVLALLRDVVLAERNRSVIADDALADDGRLFSAPAFAVIRAGTVTHFPVGANTMAFDGRKIREFLPIWTAIVAELELAGEARIRPFAEVTSRDITDSLARLSAARTRLLLKIGAIRDTKPAIAKSGGSLWPLFVGVVVAGVVIKKSRKP